MNLVVRQGSLVFIRQVPILLLVLTGVFSLPFLAFSVTMIVSGQEADGKYFCLFFGLFILWGSLEYIATRERIEVDLNAKVLKRSVDGVFRHRRQTINLAEIIDITVERWMQSTSTQDRRQRLYLNGPHEKFLVNSPAKVNVDHRKTAHTLHEVTGIPYRELRDGKEV